MEYFLLYLSISSWVNAIVRLHLCCFKNKTKKKEDNFSPISEPLLQENQMGFLLKEALRTLFSRNRWSYAIFWKIGYNNSKWVSNAFFGAFCVCALSLSLSFWFLINSGETGLVVGVFSVRCDFDACTF